MSTDAASGGHDADTPAVGPRLQRVMLERPRLLDVMRARLHRSVTVITAGAGFGKSTLLAQALADPSTRARSSAVYHRIAPTDTAGDGLIDDLTRQLSELAAGVGREAFDVPLEGAPADVSIADQLWHLSPVRVSVFVDDAHHIPVDAPGWEVLDEVVENLPDNADLVVSGRGPHPLRLARLLATGDAVEIDEAMLAFTADELADFARLRGADPQRLDDHGWPALVELEALAGLAGAHDFVAQEVVARLDPGRVAGLCRLAVCDTIDDDVVRAVVDAGTSADELLEGLPLTSRTADGGWTMHDLWRGVLLDRLGPARRAEAHVAYSIELRRRGRLRESLAAAIAGGDEAAGLDCLVEFARDLPLRHTIAERRAVVDLLPPSLERSAEAELLRADIAYASEPMLAAAPLQRAIDAATEQDRPEVTVLALLRLADLSYRSADRAGLAAARTRLARLAELGGTGADAGLVLADSWMLLLDNDPDSAIASMTDPALRRYEPVASMVDYYRAVQLGHAGRCAEALEALAEIGDPDDGRIARRVGGFTGLMTWWAGRAGPDERARSVALSEQLGTDRQVHLYVEGIATSALASATAGDVAEARRLLARAVAHCGRIPEQGWGAIAVELATASIEVLDGLEDDAARRLDRLVPDTGPFEGFARHVFGNAGALVYALVPRSRPFFDAETTGPDLALATEVGRAIVALRERQSTEPATRLPWGDVERLRTWALEPHLAELAIAAMSAGAVRATTALRTLVHDPRGAIRRVADRHPDPVGSLAATELAGTPHRPHEVVHVDVLGPTAVRFGDQPVADAAPIKRTMVRELLLLLAHRRRIRRDEIAALLWPDKDEHSGRNNLRATLNHLRQLLEVGGDDDAPPWHVRSDGEVVELFDSDLLRIDADVFDREINAARQADRRRQAAEALDRSRAALDLVRGPYAADALDPDWGFNRRTQIHLQTVEAATRASELSHGHGDLDDALAFARRAVDAEPLAEPAHRALIRALLSAGDRAGAVRAHEHIVELLAADGLAPDDETTRLGASL